MNYKDRQPIKKREDGELKVWLLLSLCIVGNQME